MIRIFTGYDPREAIGWHVFNQSLINTCREPFSVTPLYSGAKTDGTNAFTYARFRVPQLCNFEGWALFVDAADMLVREDIAKLWALRDPQYAIQVVKHDYRTTSNVKYIGTDLESPNIDYPRKNWASLMLFNCAHRGHDVWRSQTPDDLVAEIGGSNVMRLSWLEDYEVGELPVGWNHLVREYPPQPDAKLVHYTLGIPAFKHYEQDEFSDEWRGVARQAMEGVL
jgi:hypothetical protein